MVWIDAASARPSTRLRRRDLDSEGGNERSFFEWPPLTRLEARAQVRRGRSQLEALNNEGVLHVRAGGGAPRILANKRDRPEDGASAVVVGAHARGRRSVLLRAPRGRGVVTPDLAQQAGVRPNGQRQHDRKESCSKHVMLTTHKGKTCARPNTQGPRKFLWFSRARARRTGKPAEFRRLVPKIPQCGSLHCRCTASARDRRAPDSTAAFSARSASGQLEWAILSVQ